MNTTEITITGKTPEEHEYPEFGFGYHIRMSDHVNDFNFYFFKYI